MNLELSLKVLIAVDKSRFLILKPFVNELMKLGLECKMIDDLDIYGNSILNKKYFRWIKIPKQFSNIITNYNPDLVFTERTSHFSILTIKSKIPLCIFIRGDLWSELILAKETMHTSKIDRLKIRLKYRITEKCFKNATLILPICKYLQNIVRQNYPKRKTSVFYQGIDLSEWNQENIMELKHPCVGLLQGAVIWGKAQEMLVLENVLKSMPDVTFYWAGDGPHREKILSVLGKYENFKWLGNLQYPDKIMQYLSSIDVYALVSGLDMAPHTILEAAGMKKPVVATNVGGIPELMKDNETGFLVEKGDVNGWIEKLSFLINDKEKRKIMGEEGRKFVEENFNWNKIAREFLDILNDQRIH